MRPLTGFFDVPRASAALVLLASSACALSAVHQQTVLLDRAGELHGRVSAEGSAGAPLLARLYRAGPAPGEWALVQQQVTGPDGAYRFIALPGTYAVGAFVDVDRDGELQHEREPWSYLSNEGGEPLPLVLAERQATEAPALAVGPLSPVLPRLATSDGRLAIGRNTGRVVTLDDPMFDAHETARGLWRPLDFLATNGGIFMLEPYRPGVTVVLFLHGMNGSPRHFRAALAALDRSRFQPWVAYYPSGLDLDLAAGYLDHALDALQARHGFTALHVVAHSVGGLVAWSLVQQHEGARHAGDVRRLVTVNSPLRGLPSARRGVEFSPLVVAAWRDVAEGSDFVARLARVELKVGVEHHLMFSWLPGSDGDGIASLRAQLPPAVHARAARLYPLEGEHTAVLAEPAFSAALAAALAP